MQWKKDGSQKVPSAIKKSWIIFVKRSISIAKSDANQPSLFLFKAFVQVILPFKNEQKAGFPKNYQFAHF